MGNSPKKNIKTNSVMYTHEKVNRPPLYEKKDIVPPEKKDIVVILPEKNIVSPEKKRYCSCTS